MSTVGAWAPGPGSADQSASIRASRACAAASTPAARPTSRMSRRMPARFTPLRDSTGARECASSVTRRTLRAMVSSVTAQTAQSPCVTMRSGASDSSSAPSTAYRGVCSRPAAATAASISAGLSPSSRMLEVSLGSDVTSAGKSHSWLTPTIRSRSPSAQRISVPEGSRLTIRSMSDGTLQDSPGLAADRRESITGSVATSVGLTSLADWCAPPRG